MSGRIVLGASGAVLMAYGAVLALTRQDPGQLVEVALWLAAGVAVHDGLISAALIVLAVIARRLLPQAWRAPAAVAAVVWGSLTLVALPVLGRFGARADNPTLLDRPYLVSWLALFALTITAVGVAGALRSRSDAAPHPDPAD